MESYNKKEAAVVILNYNGLTHLQNFLPSVIENSPEADVIVVDNASTDESVAYLKELSGIKLMIHENNLGFSGGYNQALEQLDYTFFILLNSDVEVTPNWLIPLLQVLRTDPTAAAVQPRILSYHDRQKFEYAGAAGGYIDLLGYPFCQGRLFNTTEEDKDQYNKINHVFWGSGACLGIRKEVFHTAGGFDPDFFAHMEEVDLCWRIHTLSYKILYIPDSRVYHVGGGTLSKSSPRKTYLNFRNGITMLVKNLPSSELWWKLPLRMVLDIIAALKFTFFDSPVHGFAVIRALFSFLFHLRRDWKKRSSRADLKKDSEMPVYRKMIVGEYFLKRRKTFPELGSIHQLQR